MPVNIALIGLGAIGTELLKSLAGDPHIRITQILVRPARRDAVQAELPAGTQAICTPDAIADNVDFVLECAGHGAVQSYAGEILQRGTDFGVISVGALADDALRRDLAQAAAIGGARLSILPGAIGGIDALAAAGPDLTDVTYSARKPPLSWSGSPAEETHDLAAIDTATAIFTGTAREASLQFPKNANVVATVALAGVGFDATSVRLMADPKATGNTHQITAKGPLFDLSYTTSGAALPSNPKTSALTASSALRAVRARAPGITV